MGKHSPCCVLQTRFQAHCQHHALKGIIEINYSCITMQLNKMSIWMLNHRIHSVAQNQVAGDLSTGIDDI